MRGRHSQYPTISTANAAGSILVVYSNGRVWILDSELKQWFAICVGLREGKEKIVAKCSISL